MAETRRQCPGSLSRAGLVCAAKGPCACPKLELRFAADSSLVCLLAESSFCKPALVYFVQSHRCSPPLPVMRNVLNTCSALLWDSARQLLASSAARSAASFRNPGTRSVGSGAAAGCAARADSIGRRSMPSSGGGKNGSPRLMFPQNGSLICKDV